MTGKGQEHSRYQRGVIQRHYEHADTIALQRLSEIVSDLYLSEGAAATRLWTSARQALAKLAPADDPHIMKVLSTRSITGLARVVNELSAGAKATGTPHRREDLDAAVVGEGALAPAPMPMRAEPQPDRAGPPSPAAPSPAAPPTSSAPADLTPEQLKHAMKAFRKRLKLTRLDEESKLGRVGNPMSGGKKSAIVAIMPPREYPQAVWDELVKQGRLRSEGRGFYALVE